MKPSFSSAVVLVISLAAGLLAGCSKPSANVVAAVSGEVGASAPAWRLKDIRGNDVSSYTFKGKVVVIDFWATWCPPCREEIPGYVALQKKYEKQGLVFIGMSVDQGGVDLVKKFAEKNQINYPIVMADDAVRSAFGEMEAIPTTFVLDREGKIRHKKVGAVETSEFEKIVQPLLN